MKLLLVFLFIFINTFFYAKNTITNTRVGLITSYWTELAIKPGLILGIDWEFINSKGHGVAITFPQFLVSSFPNNFIALSSYPSISYRFIHPKNGFYTSLTMGFGINIQWKTVPVFDMEGDRITDKGFVRMFALSQFDFGYDFFIKFKQKAPLRLFFSLGWNGIFPNNLGINNHLMIQLGLNIKLKNLVL